jgi:hypothetical protein
MPKPIPEQTRRAIAKTLIEDAATKLGVMVPAEAMEPTIDALLAKIEITYSIRPRRSPNP